MNKENSLEHNFPEIFNRLNDYLVRNNMRKTSERYYILNKIYQLDTHFDVDTLYNLTKSSEYLLSKSTIYNNLELFIDSGLVMKHYFGQNLSLYEKIYGHKQHDHFICNQCKKIIEFCDPRLHQIKKTMESILNVKIENHSLYLYGLCSNPKCKK